MLYPSNWDLEEVNKTNSANSLTATARLLQQAARESYVKLQPVDALNTNNTSPLQWTNSAYTKLLAFNLTSFSRVLVLDPASKVLQNMDEPFLLPRAPIAMPYIYFGDPTGWAFSSHLMLVSPSQSSFQVVERAVKAARGRSHDVEIINQLFPSETQRLDHKRYGLFTGELRRKSHVEYLGSSTAKWDLDAILAKAKYLYYSDSPIPKPWFKASQDLLNRHMPKCVKSEWFGASNCRDREMWFKLYADYARKRKVICGVDFEVKNVVGQGNNFEY
jgi:alpha-N-acetylglucosamine transferase